MKSHHSILTFLLFLAFSACKKEIDPTLIVNVMDEQGIVQSDLTVITHPCYDLSCDTLSLEANAIQQKQSNSAGQAIFEYTSSLVLDVVVLKTITDSTGAEQEKEFQNTISIEVKELKKDEKNEYETTVVVE